jgi:hypothetical protein
MCKRACQFSELQKVTYEMKFEKCGAKSSIIVSVKVTEFAALTIYCALCYSPFQ